MLCSAILGKESISPPSANIHLLLSNLKNRFCLNFGTIKKPSRFYLVGNCHNILSLNKERIIGEVFINLQRQPIFSCHCIPD